MSLANKLVYTINAKTNTVDEWTCTGEFNGVYQGKKERLCILEKDSKSLILPKRCLFKDKNAALAVTEKFNIYNGG